MLSPRAASPLTPLYCDDTCQIARNHSRSGLRVSWKILPAITEDLPAHNGGTANLTHAQVASAEGA